VVNSGFRRFACGLWIRLRTLIDPGLDETVYVFLSLTLFSNKLFHLEVSLNGFVEEYPGLTYVLQLLNKLVFIFIKIFHFCSNELCC